jgi:CheY-like chemotaxis protein
MGAGATAKMLPTQPILVVDDHDDVREVLVAVLEAEGYCTAVAVNGADALDYLHRAPVLPCLILLDLMMPVMDGSEFREKQLAEGELAAIPVIIVSAYGQRSQGRGLGAAAYVAKPIDVDRLMHLVRLHSAPMTSR